MSVIAALVPVRKSGEGVGHIQSAFPVWELVPLPFRMAESVKLWGGAGCATNATWNRAWCLGNYDAMVPIILQDVHTV